MVTNERILAYKTDVQDILSLLSVVSLSGYGMLAQYLKEGKEKIEEGDYLTAQELLIKALQRTYGYQGFNGASQSARGLITMYLAICHHAMGDFAGALLHYLDAKEAFSTGFDGYNSNVALYACGLIYAWQRQEAKVGDVAQELCAGFRGQILSDKLIRHNLEIEQMPAETPSSDKPGSTEDISAPGVTSATDGSNANGTSTQVPKAGLTLPWVVRVGSLFLTLILFGLVVVSLMGLSIDRLVMILTLGFSTWVLYLVFDRLLRVPVRPGCYTVLQRRGDLLPSFSRTPFARRPFDKIAAFVPSCYHYTQSQKQKVATGPSTYVEIQVSFSYGIQETTDKELMAEAIRKAVSMAQEIMAPKSREHDKKGDNPLEPPELKRAWEKRLKEDISMALYDVLPSYEFKNLFCDKTTKVSTVCQELQTNLDRRSQQWGINVIEVRIVEARQGKT